MATGGGHEKVRVTLVTGEGELGLVEGADAASTPVEEVVETSQRLGKASRWC